MAPLISKGGWEWDETFFITNPVQGPAEWVFKKYYFPFPVWLYVQNQEHSYSWGWILPFAIVIFFRLSCALKLLGQSIPASSVFPSFLTSFHYQVLPWNPLPEHSKATSLLRYCYCCPDGPQGWTPYPRSWRVCLLGLLQSNSPYPLNMGIQDCALPVLKMARAEFVEHLILGWKGVFSGLTELARRDTTRQKPLAFWAWTLDVLPPFLSLSFWPDSPTTNMGTPQIISLS